MNKRNKVFKQCDLLKRKRKYFYSFAGGYQPSLLFKPILGYEYLI